MPPGAPPPLDPRVAAGLEAQLRSWQQLLRAGEQRVGWKIGLNPPAVLERLGLARPVIGHLTTATVLEPGATYSLAGGANVRVEPEVAVEVGEDAAISALAPALEVVDLDRAPDDVQDVVATNVFHRVVTIGPPAHGSLAGEATVLVNGEVAHRLVPAEAAGDLDVAVRVIADTLAAGGETLQAGDLIITGAMTAPLAVSPGDVVALDLGPLGRVELSFAA